MVLAERDEHLASLHRLLAECGAGSGHVVLIEGSVAHGKTALLRTFAEGAVEVGALFLNATCSRFENNFPLGVLSQLFRNLVLPADFRERMNGLVNGEVAVEPEMAHIFHGLLVALLELAEERPVLVGIDDVQYADILSWRCLLYLARRVCSARVLMVFTETTRLRAAHSTLRGELGELPHAHRLHIAPLSEAAASALLSERGLTTDLYATTGGNPALVRALLDERVPGGGYRKAVLSCLHRCENTVLDVARGLAVLGGEAIPAQLGELVGTDVEVVERALELMAGAGLLTSGRFRHPAIDKAVLDDLPAPERAQAHRRAARLLHDQGESAVPVARHLLNAGHPADPWAVDVLLEAAELALSADEVAPAVDCLALAHRELPEGARRLAVRAKLARAEWQLNPATAVRHFAPLLAGMHAGHLKRRDAIGIVRQLLWHGRLAQGVEVLNWVRDSSGAADGAAVTELRDVELWMASVYPALGRGHRPPRRPRTEKNTPLLLGVDPWLRSTAALAEILTRGDPHDAVTRAERFLRETPLSHTTPWSEEPALLALLTFIYTDRVQAAASECERLRSEAATRHAPTWQAIFCAVRSEIALRQGDFRTAVDQARAAVTHLSSNAWGVAVGFPLGCLILATTRRGDYDKAAEHVAHPVPEAMFQSRHGLHYLHARGHYHLSTNRYHAALADFLSCGELMRGWGLDMPGFVPWRVGAAEAWLCLDNHDEAKRLLFDQMARPGVEGTRTRALSLRVLAMASKVGRRPQLLIEAIDILESRGDRFELARALAEFGRVLHTLGEHKRARMMVRRAWHLAKACGAAALRQELMPESTAIDITVAQRGDCVGIGSLTESERRVASLAVAGYTNREIAGKLFITASTVEQHLTRVYRKLNIKYRRDLPTDLHADMATSA
ncbi:MAG: AAA family ATPase [Pseudonocardiaceae bacterium]